MKVFTGTFEVWVKPLFRKSRPKIVKVCWIAEDIADFLRFAKADIGSRYKRWSLVRWDEEEFRAKSNNEDGE